jgi:hypothetical protein
MHRVWHTAQQYIPYRNVCCAVALIACCLAPGAPHSPTSTLLNPHHHQFNCKGFASTMEYLDLESAFPDMQARIYHVRWGAAMLPHA